MQLQVQAEGLEKDQEIAPRVWTPAFVKIFVVNMLAQYCFYTTNTLSAPYADHLGATATVVGLVSGLFGVTALIFKFVSAPAIDAFSRKKVLIVSLSILLASCVGYAVSQTIVTLSISRLLTGVGLAFVPTCCITMASDVLPSKRMSEGIGFFALGTAICQAIAPAAGLKAANLFGYNGAFMILVVLMILTIGFAFNIKVSFTPINKFKIRLSSIFAKEVLVPTIILFLLNMAFCIVNAFLILYGRHQGIDSSQIGYFFTVLAITLIFSRPMIGRMADKYGTVRVIVGSMSCFAASFLLISYSKTLPLFLIAAFICAFGYAGCHPSLMAVCLKSVPKERRGAASCTSYIGQDIGNLAGPVLAGAIIEHLGYVNMWRAMILPIVVATCIAIVFRTQVDHEAEKTTAPA